MACRAEAQAEVAARYNALNGAHVQKQQLLWLLKRNEARTELEPIHLRGINTLQLMFDGKRWWIVSLMWQAESADMPLPATYLPRD